jgi:Domain of unknown function (DUF4384)
LVWSQSVPARRGLRLHDSGALPLRPGDQIRVEARLNRPAYAYLVWIDSQGVAWPVYPWTPGDWTSRPPREMPVERLALPEVADDGWPMHGPRGMETLLLLARDKPLPADVRLDVLLAGLPKQLCQDPQALAWFDNGRRPYASLGELRAVRIRAINGRGPAAHLGAGCCGLGPRPSWPASKAARRFLRPRWRGCDNASLNDHPEEAPDKQSEPIGEHGRRLPAGNAGGRDALPARGCCDGRSGGPSSSAAASSGARLNEFDSPR